MDLSVNTRYGAFRLAIEFALELVPSCRRNFLTTWHVVAYSDSLFSSSKPGKPSPTQYWSLVAGLLLYSVIELLMLSLPDSLRLRMGWKVVKLPISGSSLSNFDLDPVWDSTYCWISPFDEYFFRIDCRV